MSVEQGLEGDTNWPKQPNQEEEPSILSGSGEGQGLVEGPDSQQRHPRATEVGPRGQERLTAREEEMLFLWLGLTDGKRHKMADIASTVGLSKAGVGKGIKRSVIKLAQLYRSGLL